MKRFKWLKISLALYVIPFALGVIYYNKMPDRVATHFNFNGVPDGFSSREVAMFGITAFMLVMHLFMYFMTRKDPRSNFQGDKIIIVSMIFMPVLSTVIMAWTISYALGSNFNASSGTNILNIFLGIFFIVLGNYLPKTKRNYTIGIKVPWTLHDDVIWDKTHKLGGIVWVVCGILMVAGGLFSIKNRVWYYVIFFIATLVPVIYSYILYQKEIKS